MFYEFESQFERIEGIIYSYWALSITVNSSQTKLCLSNKIYWHEGLLTLSKNLLLQVGDTFSSSSYSLLRVYNA
jgi:hypothetical protein